MGTVKRIRMCSCQCVLVLLKVARLRALHTSDTTVRARVLKTAYSPFNLFTRINDTHVNAIRNKAIIRTTDFIKRDPAGNLKQFSTGFKHYFALQLILFRYTV